MKTNYGWKLFERDPQGNLYPLFLDKDTAYPMNVWINAEIHYGKGFAPRPGIHCGIIPAAPWLMSIDKNGNIYQNDALVATLNITDFEDYNYLEHYGENYYQPVEGAVTKAGEYQTLSGYLEMSNMSVVQEMVNMISVSRAYETNQKIVQTYDSSLEIAANQLGKI